MNSNELIIAYSRNTPNKYRMEHPTISYVEDNRVCSDQVEVFLKIEDGKLTDFSFDGYMSIVATACVAITGEILASEQTPVDAILELDERFVFENIGDDISPRRRYASLIGLLAIKNAIRQWKGDDFREDFSDIEVEK
ncbi:hypothetical protein CSB09_00815 [Candidatus Gracilibacteria bacterium]|nr:MAG: hypothetical protein CSB09_00815 [Candidatus Gracilibacteria bacterium]